MADRLNPFVIGLLVMNLCASAWFAIVAKRLSQQVFDFNRED